MLKDEILWVKTEHVSPEINANPRKYFDRDAINKLVVSMKQEGMIHPLVVKEVGDSKYRIVSGERRWRAAKLAGLHRIPVRLHTGSEASVRYTRLVENFHTENLNPLEVANAYRGLIGQVIEIPGEKEPVTINAKYAAELTGVSPSYVSQHLKLLDLHSDIQKSIESGAVSFAQAREIVGVDDRKSQMHIYEKIKSGKVKDVAAARKEKENVKAQKALKNADTESNGASKKATKSKATTNDFNVTGGHLPKTEGLRGDNLDDTLSRIKQCKLALRKVQDVRESLVTLHTKYQNAKSDNTKQYLRGAVAYAEWIAGVREEF